jgi:hypothetical protein
MMIEKQERVKFLGAVIKKLQKKNQKYYKLDSEVIVKSEFPTVPLLILQIYYVKKIFLFLFCHHPYKVNHHVVVNKHECIQLQHQ